MLLILQYHQHNEANDIVLALQVFLGVVIFGCFLYCLSLANDYITERNKRLGYQQNLIEALPDYLVYYGWNLRIKNSEVETILNKYFPYYQALNEKLKKRFLERVQDFMNEKIFIIRHHEGFKEMPVLMSAAAVQISFGLRRFKLPFFKYIQIHPQEYFAENSFRVLAGHVQGQTITIAWNHFFKNFQYADGVNVGLHEMAHALYYQHMIADLLKHRPFVDKYKEVMAICEETYNGCRKKAGKIFSNNAFKDLQEFWAESLEIFFEKPVHLKLMYPALYQQLCKLLQQDPINKQSPLLPSPKVPWPSIRMIFWS